MKVSDYFTPDESYVAERAKAVLADHLGLQVVLEQPEFCTYVVSSTVYDLSALCVRTRYHYREFDIDDILKDVSDAIMEMEAAK